VTEKFDYDGALKDLFQHDRPALLDWLARGVAVRQFLNVDLPKVQQRHADLVVDLEDDSILHIEFQSRNRREMSQRMAMYHLLLYARCKRRRLRHIVLYVGQDTMRMPPRFDSGLLQFRCEMVDIRSMRVDALLASARPADCVLAILAGGEDRLHEVLVAVNGLAETGRSRALAQLAVLCGLRALSSKLEMELTKMSIVIEVSKNVILQRIQREALEEGRIEGEAKGEAKGEVKGRQAVLRNILTARFGPLPKWAETRLSTATTAKLDKWSIKAVSAPSLEGVIGRQ